MLPLLVNWSVAQSISNKFRVIFKIHTLLAAILALVLAVIFDLSYCCSVLEYQPFVGFNFLANNNAFTAFNRKIPFRMNFGIILIWLFLPSIQHRLRRFQFEYPPQIK